MSPAATVTFAIAAFALIAYPGSPASLVAGARTRAAISHDAPASQHTPSRLHGGWGCASCHVLSTKPDTELACREGALRR